MSVVTPRWFRVAAWLGLAWNLIGVAAFFSQQSTDPLSLPDAQRVFYEETPMWATIAFAVAVACGTLGCVALVLRKSLARPLLVASLVAIVVQLVHSLGIGNGLAVFGPQGLILPTLTLGAAIALVWVAGVSARQE